MANPYDIPSINGASLAVCLAGLPFDGPVAAVRLGLIGGQWKVNPTYQELELATFDMVVAGPEERPGEVDILMVEGEAPEGAWERIQEGETTPTEEVIAEGLEVAKRAIGELVDFQRSSWPRSASSPRPFEPSSMYSPRCGRPSTSSPVPAWRTRWSPAKPERAGNLSSLKEELKAHLAERFPRDVRGHGRPDRPGLQGPPEEGDASQDPRRGHPAGRPAGPMRSAHSPAEVGLIPRAHGSGLFQRGETQVLNVTTLGMLRMNQMIDTLDPEELEAVHPPLQLPAVLHR